MNTYVAIVTYQRLPKLRNLVDNPYFWNGIDRCFILNQGGKTDETAVWLTDYKTKNPSKPLTIYHSWQNLRAIGGRQRLIDRMYNTIKPDDVIITLDDDVMVYSGMWAKRFTQHFKNSQVGAVGVQGYFVTPTWITPIFREWEGETFGNVDIVNGGWTAYRGSVFLGGCEYDQQYYPFWHCDSDFAMQVRQLGYEVWTIPNPGLAHEPHHRDIGPAFRQREEIFRKKWEGKGLLRFEQIKREQPA